MARAKKAVESLLQEEKLRQNLAPFEEQPYEIPENWCMIRLGTFANVKGGKRVPKGQKFAEYKTEHPYIRVTDFDNKTIAVEQIKYVDEETYKAIRNYTISIDDIYISIAGTIGKVGIIPEVLDGANLTENAAKITNIKGVDQRYLLWYLDSDTAQGQMKDSTISTTQPKLALFRIENLIVPLPPLVEQHRIVDRIESIFAKLDEAKEKAQAVVDGYELRKSALLHSAFTGELSRNWRLENHIDRKSWKTVSFDTIANAVDPQPSHRTPPVCSNGIAYIGIAECNYSTKEIDFESARKVGVNVLQEHLERYSLREGDFIIGKIGTVGKPFLIPALQNYALSANVVLIQPNSQIEPLFLFYQFQSDYINAQFSAGIKATTQAAFGIQKVRKMSIFLPPKNEQAEIVRSLDVLLDKETKAKEAAEAVLDQIDTMKKAVLARAFRGELGTNDPTEESAIELLKSIL